MAEEKKTWWQKFLHWFSGGNYLDDMRNAKPIEDKSSPITALFNKYTGAALTGAEQEQNLWTAMREDTQAQRAVKDYQAAGLNPALMFQNGAGGDYASASAGNVAGSGTLTDLISALTLPLQIQQMKANIVKTKEDTESIKVQRSKTLQEVKNLEATLNEIKSRTDLNDTQQSNLVVIGSYLELMQQAALSKTWSEIDLNKSTRRRIDTLLPNEVEIQRMTIKDFKENWKKIEAEIQQIANQTKLLKEDLTNYAVNRLSGPVGDLFRAWLENNRDKDKDGRADDTF